MGSQKMHKLRDRLMEELETFAKDGPLDGSKMESIYKLSESIKAIDTICAMDQRYDEDYSYAKRSYTRDPESTGYSGGYRWPMSYAEAKDSMVHELNNMIMKTQDEHAKNVLRTAMNQL